MGKRLTKSELTGLLILALIIVAILGLAFGLRGRTENESAGPKMEMEILDTLPTPVETRTVEEKKPKKKSRAKKSAAKKVSGYKEKADPFADTVPKY